MTARLIPAPTTAELLERLAGQALDDRIPDCCLPAILAELAPALEPAKRLEAFEDLCEGIVLRDGLEGGTIHWSQAIPEAAGSERTMQALEDARTRIADALATLTGGA